MNKEPARKNGRNHKGKMATRAVSAQTMKVGRKGGGKHWTRAEVSARKAAAQEITRKGPVVLEPPDWLSKRARVIWDKILMEAKGLSLFDNLDRETLAIYCDAVVNYEDCTRRKVKSIDHIKEQQAWVRIISQLGDKLGMNPAARARLVKKRAERKTDKFGKKFD
jgi:P27 family predicted phage terminase small subunit